MAVENYFKFHRFASVSEFSNYVETAKTNGSFQRAHGDYQGSTHNTYRFCGTHSFAEATQLLHNGYPEGLKAMIEGSGVTFRNNHTHIERRNDFVGQRPHIANTLAGKPKTMIRRIKIEQPQKSIDLYYDCCAHEGVNKDVLAVGGKNLMALVQHLEADGTRVNLHIMCATSERIRKDVYRTAVFTIKVKEAKQQLNPLLISYPVTHPSFFRRHILRAIECSDATNYDEYTRGYGFPYKAIENPRTAKLDGKPLFKDDQYYLDCEKVAKATTIDDLVNQLNSKI